VRAGIPDAEGWMREAAAAVKQTVTVHGSRWSVGGVCCGDDRPPRYVHRACRPWD
jgi:hypothetical protein